MGNPAEQFVPPGVDRGKVEELRNKRPTLKVIEGGKSDKAERWSTKEFRDQDKWSPQEFRGRSNTAEDFLKQKEEDEKQVEALSKAIHGLEESERASGKAPPVAEAQMQEPPMEPIKKFKPEEVMELGEEDIVEDIGETVRIPEKANKQAIDYGDMQPGMEDLPELSSEFLVEEDEDLPTLKKEKGQLPRFPEAA